MCAVGAVWNSAQVLVETDKQSTLIHKHQQTQGSNHRHTHINTHALLVSESVGHFAQIFSLINVWGFRANQSLDLTPFINMFTVYYQP